VVNVTNRAHVHVRFRTFKFFLGHFFDSEKLGSKLKTAGAQPSKLRA